MPFFQDVDVGTILLHSHVRLDDMDVPLLHIPNHDADDDDRNVDPNDVLNVSTVDPDLDVANVLVDANVVMHGSEVAHRCRFRSHCWGQRRCCICSLEWL